VKVGFGFKTFIVAAGLGVMILIVLPFGAPAVRSAAPANAPFDDQIKSHLESMFAEGRQTFRFDTFGDEAFWGDTLQLHRAITGLSPKKALGAGLKVDAEALPASLAAKIKAGQVDLDDPVTTVALLKLNAVVGITAFLDDAGNMRSVGIQCALCHSTVDDSFAPGIGLRLDGWANRDLNVGAIIAMAPDLSAITTLLGMDEATVREVLGGWGPGKFDALFFLDGKGFRPDGKTAATLIPPAFGLAGVNLNTSTGFGSLTYWNAFVANLAMHGQGSFIDSRLSNAAQYPVAANADSGNTRFTQDRITSKLAALDLYQRAIPAPTPKAVRVGIAERGQVVFNGSGKCAGCHVPPLFTEPGWNMHDASDIGIDDFQSSRSPDRKYRTTPLKGLWTHQKGGFYHDGRFGTLREVINHYDNHFGLSLSETEKNDLAEYLLSL
jgi:hypothetical protein